MKSYITYVYLDPTKKGTFRYNNLCFDYEPFYVGEGINGREKDHLKEAINNESPRYANRHKFYKIKKLLKNKQKPIILIFAKRLSKYVAQCLEINLIKTIGRQDNGKGPLLNLTDGGDVNPVLFGKNNPMYGRRWTEHQKKMHSLKVKKINAALSQEEYDAIYKKPCRPETRRKLQIALGGKNNPMYGRRHSAITKKKIGAKTKLRTQGEHNPMAKKWKVIDPQNNEIVIKSLHTFCRERNMCADSLKLAGKENRRVSEGASTGWCATEINP